LTPSSINASKNHLKAFLGSEKVKEKYVKRLTEHYDRDEIIHGVYWENGKGCAVGCIIHSHNHKSFETQLGIPEWFARLLDTLFEGMINIDAKKFPLLLLKSIPVGFDNWQHIYHKICLHIIEKECKNIDHPLVKQSIFDIINLHKTEETDVKKWLAAADAAADTAWSATANAVNSANAAACSTQFATAADSANSAAATARPAVDSVVWSVLFTTDSITTNSIVADSIAADIIRSDTYISIANKLIELFQNNTNNSLLEENKP